MPADDELGPRVPLAGRRVLLVYLFPNLGDGLLLTPVVKALLDGGARRVGVVVKAGPARVFKLVDLSVKLHVLPDALDLPAEAAGHAEAWADPEVVAAADAFSAALVAGKYEVAVDLTARADVESRRWVHATQAAHRLGWLMQGERPPDANFTGGAVDVRYQAERHWSRYQTVLLRSLGVDEPSFDVPWSIRDRATEKAADLYAGGPGPRILLVPGSRATEKRWPPERFAEIGQRLGRELDARFVVTGAPDEAALVRDLATRIGPRAATFTGKDLATLVALVHRADVVITNDTAPMHIAFLSKRPTVAIFTWMSPVCWGPPTLDPRFIVVNAPPETSEATAGTLIRVVHQQVLRLLSEPPTC